MAHHPVSGWLGLVAFLALLGAGGVFFMLAVRMRVAQLLQAKRPDVRWDTAPQSRLRTRLAPFPGLPYKTMKSKKGRGEGSSTKQPIIRVLCKNRIKTISQPIRLCLVRRVKILNRRI